MSADTDAKPALFIGSSTEGLDLARAIRGEVSDIAEITLWRDIEVLGETFLESLLKSMEEYDFAVLAVTPDDFVVSRGSEALAPRDNVMFELGLFISRLGRLRTFLVYDSTKDIKIPSDLKGITFALFDGNRSDGNLSAAVAPACDKIRKSIRREGLFPAREARQLARAAGLVEGTSERLAQLVELLARSRANELEITATMFGTWIPPNLRESIGHDLEDLRKYTTTEE
jgi:hypothetical protein